MLWPGPDAHRAILAVAGRPAARRPWLFLRVRAAGRRRHRQPVLVYRGPGAFDHAADLRHRLPHRHLLGGAAVLPRRLWRHPVRLLRAGDRSEEHTSELQSLMRISYAV